MKIEKINENQIRCTLNSSDLSERHINLSELAYGTEKARRLFHEMIQQASADFGFDAEDIPLMVEAIPLSSDSIVLNITKISDPEELDTRFSKFSPPSDDMAENALPSFPQNMLEGIVKNLDNDNTKEETGEPPVENNQKIFSFSSLDDLTAAARNSGIPFAVGSVLYLNRPAKEYFLVISKLEDSPGDFGKACNIMAEFGRLVTANYATSAYYEEHFETIIASDALTVLASL